MTPKDIEDPGVATFENAKRLHEDAELLEEMDRFPTAFALAVLAQEEYAKAFMLHLASEQAFKPDATLSKALSNHLCKQLVALIMEYLQRKDFFELRNEPGIYCNVRNLPKYVIDAIHIIVHEYTRGLKRHDWLDPDDRKVDPKANRIATGVIDREKQNGFYVRLTTDGIVRNKPDSISAKQCRLEMERTAKVADAVWVSDGKLKTGASLELPKIIALFQVLSGLMSVEEFNRNWW